LVWPAVKNKVLPHIRNYSTGMNLGFEILELYRARNDIEAGFRDLKHGIDWRPARCTSEDAIRGRILISFLSLFSLHAQSAFSLTVMIADGEQKRRVFSNFRRIVRRLWYGKASFPMPKAPGQTTLDGS